MRVIKILLGLTIVGAVATVLVMFLKQAYTLISNGVPRDRVPVEELLLDVMKLDQFAIYGAIGGAVLAVLILVIQGLSALMNKRGAKSSKPEHDPHAILQARREQIADEYLASRQQQARP